MFSLIAGVIMLSVHALVERRTFVVLMHLYVLGRSWAGLNSNSIQMRVREYIMTSLEDRDEISWPLASSSVGLY